MEAWCKPSSKQELEKQRFNTIMVVEDEFEETKIIDKKSYKVIQAEKDREEKIEQIESKRKKKTEIIK